MVFAELTLFIILIAAIVGLVLLYRRADSRWNRSVVLFLLIALPLGALSWFYLPWHGFGRTVMIPFYLLAMILGWQLTTQGTGEPGTWHPDQMTTQEALRGPAGTREALRLYFGLVILVVAVVLFLHTMMSALMGNW